VKIGVLALQGDFAEHRRMLQKLGVETSEVRLPSQLEDLDGLIIPGGESTTMGKLATTYGLIEPLREFGKQHAVWGTCAGAIFIAKEVPPLDGRLIVSKLNSKSTHSSNPNVHSELFSSERQ